MRITDALKNENVRLSAHGKWMVWIYGQWVVYKSVHGKGKEIGRYDREELGIEVLLNDEIPG
jgi:hypothetical protein